MKAVPSPMRTGQADRKSPKSSPVGRTPERRETSALPRTLKARSRGTDTALQRHVSFFDDNGDRAVDVVECTRGLKALGLPVGMAEAAALAIVAPLSIQTRGSLLAMKVDIDSIHKSMHDSDTGILDKRGRFSARRFNKVFGKHSGVGRDGDKVFTATALTEIIGASRETLLGTLVSTAEWRLLLALAADTEAVEDGRTVPALSAPRIKSFYDGTLFYTMARERARVPR
jgi:peroxygenase